MRFHECVASLFQSNAKDVSLARDGSIGQEITHELDSRLHRDKKTGQCFALSVVSLFDLSCAATCNVMVLPKPPVLLWAAPQGLLQKLVPSKALTYPLGCSKQDRVAL